MRLGEHSTRSGLERSAFRLLLQAPFGGRRFRSSETKMAEPPDLGAISEIIAKVLVLRSGDETEFFRTGGIARAEVLSTLIVRELLGFVDG